MDKALRSAVVAAVVVAVALAGPVGAEEEAPAVGGASNADGDGLWVGWSDGRVTRYGDAISYGQVTGRLAAPVVDLAASVQTGPNNGQSGYVLVAADGGVFTYGNAAFRGSAGGTRLHRPVVGMATDPDGSGYWLAAADGGIFAYDARFHGSAAAFPLNQPIVGVAPSATGEGYVLAARDGGVFAFGDAAFRGSLGTTRLVAPVVAVAADPDGSGYWLAGSDGGVFSFDAAFHGSAAGRGWIGADDRVVGIEAHPGGGYFLLTASGGAIGFGAAALVVSPPG